MVKNSIKNNKLKLLVIFVVLVTIGLIFPKILASPGELRTIYIESKNLDFASDSGAWQIEESAKWLSSTKAEITLNVSSNPKEKESPKDIIFVFDSSITNENFSYEEVASIIGDMYTLSSELLETENNRVALISFSKNSEIKSDLTNDAELISEKFYNLREEINTNYYNKENGESGDWEYRNYYQALLSLGSLLKEKKDELRDCTVLFMTSGYPNINTPNEIGYYSYLKKEYPNVSFNALQFGPNNSMIDHLKKVSERQKLLNTDTPYDAIYDLAELQESYDRFEITNYLGSDFYIASKDDVTATSGSLDVNEKTGKITWNLTGMPTNSSNITMTINARLKTELLNTEGIYSLNETTEVASSIANLEESITTNDTPSLSNRYKVTYNINAPSDCNSKDTNIEESLTPYTTNLISTTKPVCEGYQFKGWNSSDINKLNDDYYIMPDKDITFNAEWSKITLKKSMTGTIKENLTLYKKVESDATVGKSEEYKGATDTFKGEEKIYYYPVKSQENHVIFANYCWKIVRTTDTGGVKLLYDGVPSENGTCNNHNDNVILTKEQMNKTENKIAFNTECDSIADVGYMQNTRYQGESFSPQGNLPIYESVRTVSHSSFDFADSYRYENGIYYLNNPEELYWSSGNAIGKYTFGSLDGGLGFFPKIYYATTNPSDSSLMRLIDVSNPNPAEGMKLTVGSSLRDNGNGTFTLSSPITLNKLDSDSTFGNYKNYYLCEGSSTTCSNPKKINNYNIFNSEEAFINYNDVIKYGKSFTYSGGKYKLTDMKLVTDWESEYNNLNEYHYTCFNGSGECENIYYVYNTTNSRAYYITLSGGKDVNTAINEMLYNSNVNTNNSNIKQAIDYWYQNNMADYSKYLEDTVWCNDRSMDNKTENGWNPNGGKNNVYANFKLNGGRFYLNESDNKLQYINDSCEIGTCKPDLTCKNNNDRFTVNSENGNGALTYPVGLITKQEEELTNENFSSQVEYDSAYWHMSPYNYGPTEANIFYLDETNKLSFNTACQKAGVRPSISLKPGIEYLRGDGSTTSPYIISLIE